MTTVILPATCASETTGSPTATTGVAMLFSAMCTWNGASRRTGCSPPRTLGKDGTATICRNRRPGIARQKYFDERGTVFYLLPGKRNRNERESLFIRRDSNPDLCFPEKRNRYDDHDRD